jgi:WD repeat-containing protein 81
MHFVSQTNHRNLWKSAYKKYVNPDATKASATSSEGPTLKKSKPNNDHVIQNLLPHDAVLRDIITRVYACRIIDARVEIVCRTSDNEDTTPVPSDAFTHPNMYPTICAIETHNNFFVIHQPFVQYTLRDLQYSPAILSESHNKPLFILYQLINLIRSMHDRNLLLGNIGMEDIFLTENLWLQVIPKLDKNLLVYEDWIEQQEVQNPTIKRHLSTSCVSDFGKTSVQLQPAAKIERELPAKYSLNEYCKMWCHGELSNFDYLTILNDLSGRRKGNPLNGYIFPWVTDFSGRNGMVWRDLTKSKYRLNKGEMKVLKFLHKRK